jgi:hypothetical protein
MTHEKRQKVTDMIEASHALEFNQAVCTVRSMDLGLWTCHMYCMCCTPFYTRTIKASNWCHRDDLLVLAPTEAGIYRSYGMVHISPPKGRVQKRCYCNVLYIYTEYLYPHCTYTCGNEGR